jgi:hypothetical protein
MTLSIGTKTSSLRDGINIEIQIAIEIENDGHANKFDPDFDPEMGISESS